LGHHDPSALDLVLTTGKSSLLEKEFIMFGVSSSLAIAGLVISLLSASCEVGVNATPVSLHVDVKGRYTPSDSQNVVCDMIVPQPDGSVRLYRDIDCDGIADYVLIGNRWIPLGHGGGMGPYQPGSFKPVPKEMPWLDPGYQNRKAADLIRETGLDDLGDEDDHRQVIWLHGLSTSQWTMDVTIPSTSRCDQPDFRQYDLDLEWTVIHCETDEDFEAWRVSGSIDEALRFLVDCGVQAFSMDTLTGRLDVFHDETTGMIHVMLDGADEYSVPID
tara:strand:- start:93 stop:914 length:822 start_codon:yes stop_codon:yes gene_type:complete